MTAARKPRTDLRVVASKTSGPDLEAMERVLQESTRDMAPMISRTAATRARVILPAPKPVEQTSMFSDEAA